MKYSFTFAIFLVLAPAAYGAEDEKRFDGNWDTTVSCRNYSNALGYSYEIPSTMKDGEFYAAKGEKGKPGWLEIKGRIEKDGAARLYASGLVGAHQYAVGGLPAGAPYGYHVAANFKGDEGTGKRVEGRPCDYEFKRQKQ